MPLNLADYARLSTNPVKRGVVDVFRRESILMDRLRFDPATSLSLEVLRTKSLPSVAFRKIGANHAESKGQIEPVTERLFSLGGYVDVDYALEKAQSIVKMRALQTDLFTTSVAYAFNDYAINGNPLTDVDGFTGLWYRLKTQLPAAQSIQAGGPLEIQAGATGLSANQDTALDKIDALIDACDGHKADLLIMNSATRLRLYSTVRMKALLRTDQDSFGRKIDRYGPGGPEIVDIGVKADQVTNIIGTAELADGTALTGGASSSVYAVRLGEGKYLSGMQLYDLRVEDIGLLENGVTFRTLIDWVLGIYMVNPRSVARLHGLRVA